MGGGRVRGSATPEKSENVDCKLAHLDFCAFPAFSTSYSGNPLNPEQCSYLTSLGSCRSGVQ